MERSVGSGSAAAGAGSGASAGVVEGAEPVGEWGGGAVGVEKVGGK